MPELKCNHVLGNEWEGRRSVTAWESGHLSPPTTSLNPTLAWRSWTWLWAAPASTGQHQGLLWVRCWTQGSYPGPSGSQASDLVFFFPINCGYVINFEVWCENEIRPSFSLSDTNYMFECLFTLPLAYIYRMFTKLWELSVWGAKLIGSCIRSLLCRITDINFLMGFYYYYYFCLSLIGCYPSL